MTASKPIETLFVHDIRRRIEEVIKVDQTDGEVIRMRPVNTPLRRQLAVSIDEAAVHVGGWRTVSADAPGHP